MPDSYWTCPGCGLLCDDLPEPPSPTGKHHIDCSRSRSWSISVSPVDQTLPSLVQQSKQLERLLNQLRSATSPLVWLGDTDVDTARGAMRLADALHATVALDQSHQTDAIHRYLSSTGQMIGTLGEIRARADLIVLLGDGWSQRTPRLRERLTPNPDSRGVFIDPYELTRWFELKTDERWVDLLAVVRQRVTSRVSSNVLPPSEDEEFNNLADQLTILCQTRRYIAWIWHEDALGPSADLILTELLPLVDHLNQTTRSISLRLEDRPGLMTANQVCTWQTGYAPPVALTGHGPQPLEQINLDAYDFVLVVSDLGIPQYVPEKIPHVRMVPATAVHDPDRDVIVNTCGLQRGGYVQRGDMAWMLRVVSSTAATGASAVDCLDWLTERVER